MPCRLPVLLFLLASCATLVRAESTDDVPSSKREIEAAVRSITQQFGPDAAVLQGHLLAQLIAAGSLLETSVRVAGAEQYAGRPYLGVHVDTGIIYDDRHVAPADRPRLLWAEVVRPVLAKFKHLEVPGDGLALHMSYRHGVQIERAGLTQRLADGSLASEAASFHILSADVPRLAESGLADEELARSVPTTVDGHSVELRLPAPSPTPAL
jgi:hypothetical protein